MRAPAFTAADFVAALQQLLPRGRVWPRDPDATQAKALTGLGETPTRLTQRANYLLVDSFPRTSVELLPEWEQSLGLPDPCAGDAPTLQQRQNEVVARFTNAGGQSAPYFVSYAANLGYTITITNFCQFRAGRNRVGDAVGGDDWPHAWAINAPLNSVTYFRAGRSAVGEPLGAWGNEVLECELSRLKPAHTILQFRYS